MVKIEKTVPATDEEWDVAWRGCDYATFFHSRDWAEIWNVYTCGDITPCPKKIGFSDGLSAVIPLCVRSMYKGLTKRYISSPAGTYGGWISADPLGPEHGRLLAGVMTSLGNLEWRLNPYCEITPKSGLPLAKEDVTHSISLEDGFDAVFKSWSKGHRAAPRQAMKLGMTVRLALSLDDWKAYYRVYEDSLRRWGNKATSEYGFELFHEMFKRKSPGIRLWLADYVGKIVAGALCLYAKNHVVYWHGATLEEHFHRRPVNLLMYEAIKDSCESGFRWFDFNPSGEHEGVTAFKKNFGATALQAPVVVIQPKIINLLRRLKK